MRRFAIAFLALGLTMCLSTGAKAGALSSLVADGVTINQMEDNDFEKLLGDGDNFVEVGEDLVAMFEIRGLDAPIGNPVETNFSPSTASFTGVTVIRVTGVTAFGGPTEVFTFGAAPAASWTALGLPAPTALGTLAMIFDDPASAPADHIVANTGTLVTSLATATDGTLLWEFGFTGALGAPAAGEFWTATANDIITFAPTDITKLTSLSFFAALNVTASTPAVGGLVLLPHTHLFPAATQVQLAGFLAPGQNTFPAPALPSDFDIATDTDIFILPTPEPSSITLFGLGLAGLGIVGYRRRKRQQAA